MNDAVDVHGAIDALTTEARGEYLGGLALCLQVMWDLVMELLDKGESVPYERAVRASTAWLIVRQAVADDRPSLESRPFGET